MSNDDIIISGPSENYASPKGGSMGKYIIDCLKKRGRNEVIIIDAVTGDTLKCGELIDEVMKLAYILKQLGIEKGDVITIMSENTIRYCVPIIAGLYMGVAVNTLDQSYTDGEVKHALGITKPKLILCSKLVLPTILAVKEEFGAVKIILMGVDQYEKVDVLEAMYASLTMQTPSIDPAEFNGTQHVAFILLSSGTTGLPKGVQLTHDNLRMPTGFTGDSRYVGLTSSDVTLVLLPLSHIFGILILFGAMVIPTKTILLKKFQPDVFLKTIEQHGVTFLPLVPLVLVFIASHPMVKNYNLSSLRLVFSGAAPLTKNLQERASEILNIQVRQAYGMTEVAGAIASSSSNAHKSGSVGKLLPDTQMKVWDAVNGKTLEPNKVGEFWIKSPTVMKGYLGVPISDDVIDKDGFCHTGDVGYYDEEGYLYIVDRNKDMFKYKGHQVAPTELENILIKHPEIVDCAVIGVPNERVGEAAFAFVVRKGGSDLTKEEVVQFVAERMSMHKHLHGGVRFVDAVPRNQSGKLLRKGLLQSYLAST